MTENFLFRKKVFYQFLSICFVLKFRIFVVYKQYVDNASNRILFINKTQKNVQTDVCFY